MPQYTKLQTKINQPINFICLLHLEPANPIPRTLDLVLFSFIKFLILLLNMNITGRIETPDQVLRHPVNNSSAKTHWSFAKAPRFPDHRGCTNTISYDLPSNITKRATGIGYGSRSKVFDGNNTTHPSPGKYEAPTSFSNHKQKRGFSFGYNRDELKYSNYLKQLERTPAAYPVNDSLLRTSRSYSMRPKTAYPKNYFIPNNQQAKRLTEFPGPGNYQSIDEIGSGRDFYCSKNRTNRQKSFQGKSRFSNEKKTPGPADYSFQKTIEADGIYFLSNMRSSGRRQILNQKRELTLAGNRQTPGPGQYQKPSDFGHYDPPKKTITRPKTARN